MTSLVLLFIPLSSCPNPLKRVTAVCIDYQSMFSYSIDLLALDGSSERFLIGSLCFMVLSIRSESSKATERFVDGFTF